MVAKGDEYPVCMEKTMCVGGHATCEETQNGATSGRKIEDEDQGC